MRLLFLGLLVLGSLLVSCETTRRSVSTLGEFDLTHAEATRAWLVEVDGAIVGEVVRYDDFEGGRFFYLVRNPLHQELGLIDAAGRAYRYRAHQPEPTWLGTNTVPFGVREILGADERAQLREVELAELLER